DRDRRPGRFLLLGSASFDLIRDASETLAGRIAIEELTGLRLDEVDRHASITEHWLRGGFPDALLAPDDDLSLLWRENLIRTYVERDVPSYGVQAGPALLRRLLTMVAHLSGQQLNVQSLSNSLQLNGRTVEKYLSLLEQTFTVRRLPAYHTNVGKRLIKTPKIYLRDTGLLHTLLNLPTHQALSKHPVFGASFESYVVEQVFSHSLTERTDLYYYRTTNGAEMDLVLVKAGEISALVEIKTSPQPKLSKGFHISRNDLGKPPTYIVTPNDVPAYALEEKIQVIGPRDIKRIFQ
ncbi:MAG: DUF4143 domain-containing protein, partial [Bacteroidota bacterium]